MANRMRSIGTNPTIRNYAIDASQSAIRPIAEFFAPTVEVPTLTGQYKVYDAKHRYKRPNAKRAAGGKATVIGFTAEDANFRLVPKALDFPIDVNESINDEGLLNQAKYGTALLADAAGLDHELTVIETALATLGAGTDVNFAAANFDPVPYFNKVILEVKKLAKNGAKIKILFGPTAVVNWGANPAVINRFNRGKKDMAVPDLSDISNMLFGKPECQVAEMVYDAAPEGADEDMKFVLDDDIIVFASNDQPNTMDPSFMKTFRLMGKWMAPGGYQSEDGRDEFLKMDWIEGVYVTNAVAGKRFHAKTA